MEIIEPTVGPQARSQKPSAAMDTFDRLAGPSRASGWRRSGKLRRTPVQVIMRIDSAPHRLPCF